MARYEYDASNRRVRKLLPSGMVLETAWHGWKELEEYEDGVLTERRTYGLGLDEAVKVEVGRGTLDLTYVPLYDSSGNVAALTDETGKPVERYVYSAYGKRTILADLTPPRIEQVRVVGGEMWIESSEEVLLEAVEAAVSAGTLTLVNTATGQPISISASQPLREGRQAGRRVVLTLEAQPAANTSLSLTVEPEAWTDTFLNSLAEPFELPFIWPASDAVLTDLAAPRVEQVLVRNRRVEIELSEEVPASSLVAVNIDGTSLTWTPAANHYRWQSVEELGPGSYQLTVSTQLADLSGTTLASEHVSTFALGAAEASKVVFQARDPREIDDSSLGNLAGFHGRPVDPETGLMFFRHRFYDVEMGRFVAADPLGFVDGPSAYTAFGADPVNMGDPLGLDDCTWWNPLSWKYCRSGEEAEPSTAPEKLDVSKLPPLYVEIHPIKAAWQWLVSDIETQLKKAKDIFSTRANIQLSWRQARYEPEISGPSLTEAEADALLDSLAVSFEGGKGQFSGLPVVYIERWTDATYIQGQARTRLTAEKLFARDSKFRAALVARYAKGALTHDLTTAHELGHSIGGLCDPQSYGGDCGFGVPKPSPGGLMYYEHGGYPGLLGEELSDKEVLRLRRNAQGVASAGPGGAN